MYKRQITNLHPYSFLRSDEGIYLTFVLLWDLNIYLPIIFLFLYVVPNAVSYTHLDVYKRQ